MPVNPISSAHSFHIPTPGAPAASQGKFAQSPAFQARAGEWPEGTNFGKLVSAIAKAKHAAAPEAPTTPEPPADTTAGDTPPATDPTTPTDPTAPVDIAV